MGEAQEPAAQQSVRLVRVQRDCFTKDCRRLKPGDVVIHHPEYDEDGRQLPLPRYYKPLTELEAQRFYARASDEEIEAATADTGLAPAPKGGAGTPKPAATETPAQKEAKLLAALAKLDPSNPGHWTSSGQPLMAAVEEFYGSDEITRADIMAVAPVFSRENPSTGIPGA